MSTQYGFYINTDRCVQCHACEVACKAWNRVDLGIKWRRVADFWGGNFPEVTNQTVSFSCMHCAKPACVESCPTHALVLLDPEQVAQGSVTLRKAGRLMGLGFVAAGGLSAGGGA